MLALDGLTDHLSRSVLETVSGLESLAAPLVPPVQFVAFWMAAILPFTYLPLLATGAVAEHATAFVAVLCLNAVALVLGHGHRRPSGE